MTDETGTITYTYDDFNNLTTETKGDIIKINTYDVMGNLLTETGTGHSVTNTYNKANLPVTKVNKKNGTVINNYSMSYDLAGNKTQIDDLMAEFVELK